jgi:hypothetical protein
VARFFAWRGGLSMLDMLVSESPLRSHTGRRLADLHVRGAGALLHVDRALNDAGRGDALTPS